MAFAALWAGCPAPSRDHGSAERPPANGDDAARARMVAEQLRERDISDPRVLAATGRGPHTEFVPASLRAFACGDEPLPIDLDQNISPPVIVAHMTQLARPQPEDRGLDIGPGSGYPAAMDDNLQTVLTSVLEVFGLVGVAYLYARRVRFDAQAATRIGMDLLVPCLTFAALLDSRITMDELPVIAAATVIQVTLGLLIGWIGLRLLGWQWRRELLLPIAFLNSANIFYPLLLANFGVDGLSRGLLINTTVNVLLFSVGIAILHGGGRSRDVLRQPALWVTLLAVVLRLLHIQPPDLVMRIPRLAGTAAVPLMLILFGHALAGARLRSLRAALVGTLLRYASGAVALAVILLVLAPQGLLRKVLVLYTLLPSAMINVLLTQRAGRDAEAVASTIVLTTLVALGLLPLLLLAVG